MDPDPDPRGPKIIDPTGPDLESDPEPQHCFQPSLQIFLPQLCKMERKGLLFKALPASSIFFSWYFDKVNFGVGRNFD